MQQARQALRVSPNEPLSHLCRIPIVESGEPLVDYLRRCPRIIQDRPRYDYRPETLLREGAADRLSEAAERLPDEYRLSVIEGWRSRGRQRLQYESTREKLRAEHPEWPEATLRRVVNRCSAPPHGPAPAPHTTGGAVDVWLCDSEGKPLDLSAPYDAFDRSSFGMNARRLAAEVRRRRTVLQAAMESAGFTNYPAEYWHWSFGDQGWAYRGGHSFAIYGATEPS